MAVDYNRNTFDLSNTVVVKLKQAWQGREGLFSQTILQFSTLWRHLSSPLSFSPEINSHPLSSDWTVLRVGASFRMEFSLLWRKSVQSATHLHIPLHLHSIALLPSHLHCGQGGAQPVVCGSAGTKSRIRKVGSKFASSLHCHLFFSWCIAHWLKELAAFKLASTRLHNFPHISQDLNEKERGWLEKFFD